MGRDSRTDNVFLTNDMISGLLMPACWQPPLCVSVLSNQLHNNLHFKRSPHHAALWRTTQLSGTLRKNDWRL